MENMADQIGTPGSNADLSINGSKNSAPKDKNCPFCHQAFTSSSLGRHLDLYIKEKNPKPADGIHSVDEIRKMRGGITRRQPRVSTSGREDSTPAGTPGASERRSPNNDSEMSGNASPTIRKDDGTALNMVCMAGGRAPRSNFVLNGGTWETTGVMNHIPTARNGEQVRNWDDNDSRDGNRRLDRGRSVSKQMLAKTTFEQKQKMMEALDNAKAAELALRELLGGIRAAKHRIDGPEIFDYDPFSLDFPALTLHCLPPPPTLYASTPIPNSTSWSILPPDEQQYQALRKHFASEFHTYRVSLSIATTTPPEDLSYPPQQHSYNSVEDINTLHQQAEHEAQTMEAKISEHLHSMFAHWTSIPQNKRTELWTLELARNIGRKYEEISSLKKERALLKQETAHAKLQVEQLSRLQQPREYKIQPPSPLPIDSRLMTELGEMGSTHKSVGLRLMDRNVHLDTAVERAIGRWKGVVKQARGVSGLATQKPLETPPMPPSEPQLPPSRPPQQTNNAPASTTTEEPMQMNGGDIGSDQDADGDADMEEDDAFVEMADVNGGQVQRAPEAQMNTAQMNTAQMNSAQMNSAAMNTAQMNSAQMSSANFRLANGVGGGLNVNVQGNAGGNSRGAALMDGIENTNCVQGYVRIGA